jgi:hypothetical protein
MADRPDLSGRPRGERGQYSMAMSCVARVIALMPSIIAELLDDSEPATVKFTLSNRHELLFYFPQQGACFLIPDAHGKQIVSPSAFRSQFNCPIGFVPILGPVEHHERLYQKHEGPYLSRALISKYSEDSREG